MFSIWRIFQTALLLINAIAVLNEERFLRKFGFGYTTDSMLAASQQTPNGAPTKTGLPIKLQIINLLHAVRTLLRIPLIILNIVAIGLSLVFG